MFTPVLTVYAGADGSISVGVSTGVTQQASVTAGVRYANGSWSPISSHDSQFGFQPPSIKATFDARAYVGTSIQLMLYGVAGPEASIEAYLSLHGDAFADQIWSLRAGMKASAGAKVQVLSLVVAEWETDLFDWSTELAAAPSRSEFAYTRMARQPDGTGVMQQLLVRPGKAPLKLGQIWKAYDVSWSPDARYLLAKGGVSLGFPPNLFDMQAGKWVSMPAWQIGSTHLVGLATAWVSPTKVVLEAGDSDTWYNDRRMQAYVTDVVSGQTQTIDSNEVPTEISATANGSVIVYTRLANSAYEYGSDGWGTYFDEQLVKRVMSSGATTVLASVRRLDDTEDGYYPQAEYFYWPLVSPNGAYVASARVDPNSQSADTMEIRSASSGAVVRTVSGSRAGAWTTDGHYLGYTSSSSASHEDAKRLDVTTGVQTTFDPPGASDYYEFEGFSPDGKKFGVTGGSGGWMYTEGKGWAYLADEVQDVAFRPWQ